MSQRRYKQEQIINKLREVEVELSKGQTTGHVSRKLGITIDFRNIPGGENFFCFHFNSI